jgi:hypothetical protein
MLLPLFQSGEIKLFLKGLQSFSLEDVKAKHSSFSLVFHLSQTEEEQTKTHMKG